jgi:pyrimidine-nucleoside phosphorylase
VTFSPYDLLNRKRRGEELPAGEIRALIERFTSGELADYQMSAFLMAVAINGATPRETAALTAAMLESGEQWRLRDRYDFVADKHSTGGVGDKVSLVLAPLLASCGVKCAMLSGRGLGHTGGTLDKLETIPGFRARLTRQELERVIDDAGCVIATSTAEIAPADRRMYELRDVTGTVESIPLITASIMSKKLALGASALLLDVKAGRGAFASTSERAAELARSLIAAADGSGTQVKAIITDMDQPLGAACGNANEVAEAFDVLRDEGPADVRELSFAQAEQVLLMSGGGYTPRSARTKVRDAVSSGAAAEAARRWLAAQGADPEILDHPERLPQPREVIEIRADRTGVVQSIDAYGVGMLAIDLGAGRKSRDDAIDPAAGIMLERKRGDDVREGEVIARILIGARSPEVRPATRLASLIHIGDETPAPRALVMDSWPK